MKGFLVVIAAALPCASAALAKPSTFQRSCSDIRVERPADDVAVVATCRDRTGQDKPAHVYLIGYHNIDGRLIFDGKGKASFQHTCDRIDITSSPQRVTLVASCKARDQTIRAATIELRDIENIDGRLVQAVRSVAASRSSSAASMDDTWQTVLRRWVGDGWKPFHVGGFDFKTDQGGKRWGAGLRAGQPVAFVAICRDCRGVEMILRDEAGSILGAASWKEGSTSLTVTPTRDGDAGIHLTPVGCAGAQCDVRYTSFKRR